MAAVVASAVTVALMGNLVNASIDVEVMNAILLPVVLGFLLVVEARALPVHARMRGVRRAVVWGWRDWSSR